jgi:Ceramidase
VVNSEYCERVGTGWFAEPFNAVSNVAFLIASAVLLWLLVRQPRSAPVSVWLLPVLLGVVGLCSLSFHTLASPLTGALDTLSILVFVLVGVVVVVHWMWDVRWRPAWLGAPAFLVFAIGLDTALFSLGGSRLAVGGYLPAWLGLVGIGLAVRLTAPGPARRYGTWLLWAGAVFAVSLTARTVDRPLCGHFPTGTHFIWHVLNAIVLFTVGRAVLARWRERRMAG